MKIRFSRRKDDPVERRWFVVLHGIGFQHLAGYTITRVFFPWFYCDLLFPNPYQ